MTQPIDTAAIQRDAQLVAAIQHEADTTPATYQANHQLHSPRLLAAAHRLLARVAELEQQVDRLTRDYAAEERLHAQTITERDRAADYADRLADRIAPSSVTGEHSISNCPWQNALDYDGPATAPARDGR